MSTGERLLDLADEYRDAKEARADDGPGIPLGREPSVIAAEYEVALRELLA